jgi:hypothetical protein
MTQQVGLQPLPSILDRLQTLGLNILCGTGTACKRREQEEAGRPEEEARE